MRNPIMVPVLLGLTLVVAGCSTATTLDLAGGGSAEPAAATPAPEPEATDELAAAAAQTQQVADTLVGLTVAQAEQRAEAAHKTTRVAVRDGEHVALTMDYRSDRINLIVDDGKVTTATVG